MSEAEKLKWLFRFFVRAEHNSPQDGHKLDHSIQIESIW